MISIINLDNTLSVQGDGICLKIKVTDQQLLEIVRGGKWVNVECEDLLEK